MDIIQSPFYPQIMEKSVKVEKTIPKFKKLIKQGYTTGTWKANPGACPKCKRLNGKRVRLRNLVDNAKYKAPMYTRAKHPGCLCSIHIGESRIKV